MTVVDFFFRLFFDDFEFFEFFRKTLLGQKLRKSILGRPGGSGRASGGVPGAPGSVPGASWDPLGGVLGRLGALLGRSFLKFNF